MSKRDEEVALVVAVLRHPAGFDLSFAGDFLRIRSTEHATIEVERYPKNVRSFAVKELEQAARFFVEIRHELKCGLDYEAFKSSTEFR